MSHGGDSLTFLSVSSGVGEVASPLVSSAVGSPGAVARTSDSPGDRVAGYPGDIEGLFLAQGFVWSPLCLVQWPLHLGFIAQCGPTKDSSISEGDKRHHACFSS